MAQRAEKKYTTFIGPRRDTTGDVVSLHVIKVLFSTACTGDTEPRPSCTRKEMY